MIDAVDVDGPVDVYASNVTIRHARIRCGPYWCVRQHDGARNLTLEDADIGPDVPRSTADGLWVASFRGRRLMVHNVSDGMKAWSDVRLEDSSIGRLTTAVDDHSDGVQIQGGTGIMLRRNQIEGGTNAAVFVSAETGPVGNIEIAENELSGGAYTVSVRPGPFGNPARIELRNNVFSGSATYGNISSTVPIRLSGNRESNGRLVHIDPG